MVDFFYSHPIWQVGLLVIGIWTGLALLGLFLFQKFSDAHSREKDTETVGLTYAIVAVVYAVLIAFIVAAPLGWYAVQQWLQTYAFRIDISWLFFVIPFITVAFIAMATVSYLSIKAALMNPVLSLKVE